MGKPGSNSTHSRNRGILNAIRTVLLNHFIIQTWAAVLRVGRNVLRLNQQATGDLPSINHQIINKNIITNAPSQSDLFQRIDGKARIFIGSSSEGKPTAEIIASALELAGMRPLLWANFFKTSDIPLQELDRRMADADGAILIGSLDDKLISRGREFQQMRDNVLLEYGLFAGHLGRHRCILLMPDHQDFRIPSDFLGVAGFEYYTSDTVISTGAKILVRLQTAFQNDGFKPPSIQERGRRLLLLSGWVRGEIAKIKFEYNRFSRREHFESKIRAIIQFLNDDINTLEIKDHIIRLEELIKKATDNFPYVIPIENMKETIRRDVENEYFGRRGEYFYYIDRITRYEDFQRTGDYRFDFSLTHGPCPRGSRDDRCLCYCRFGERYDRNFGEYSLYRHCPWFAGSIEMLNYMQIKFSEYERIFEEIELWQQTYLTDIFNQLDIIEKAAHSKIFGHL